MTSDPWAVLGDFNVILQMNERFDFFLGMPVPRNVQNFRECMDTNGLTALYSAGSVFTWSNNKGGSIGYIVKKLDRVLVNDQWQQKFDKFGALFNPPDYLNHCSGLVFCRTPFKQKTGAFRFFNFLTRHRSFSKLVCDT